MNLPYVTAFSVRCTASSSVLRRSLLTSVAAISLLLVAPAQVRAQTVPPASPCNTVTGTTVTCTGNLAAGVAITSPTPYTVLNVSGLTQNISPSPGQAGISFHLDGSATTDLTVISDTGAFAINTIYSGVPGTRPNGIDVQSRSLTGNLTIQSTGTINSGGNFAIAGYLGRYYGTIDQAARGDVNITSNGDITAKLSGIRASAQRGAVSITASGSVTSITGGGMLAMGSGPVIVNNDADITSASYGVFAASPASVTVNSTGDIRIVGRTPAQAFNYSVRGISISSNGDTTVNASGNITMDPQLLAMNNVRSYGISTFSTGGATAPGAGELIRIDTSANITAQTGVSVIMKTQGFFNYDNIVVTNSGTINATRNGLYGLVCPLSDSFGCSGSYARPTADTITLTNTASGIINTDRLGIVAVGEFLAGGVRVVNDGLIDTGISGVVVREFSTFDTTVNVTNTGTIRSGVNQTSGSDAVNVQTSGNAVISNTGTLISAHRSAVNVVGEGQNSDVTVTNSGFMSSGATDNTTSHYTYAGIAVITYQGSVNVTNEVSGRIDAAGDGIEATANIITVSNAGIINTGIENGIQGSGGATGFDGIAARGYGGATSISHSGTINSVGNGILAETKAYYRNADAVNVTSSGNITASHAGIRATSIEDQNMPYITGPVTVRQTGGTITAQGEGIFAQSNAGPVTVEQTAGRILAGTQGILAYSLLANVTVEAAGSILAAQEGISAVAFGGAVSVSQTGGTITSTGTSGIGLAGASQLSVAVAGTVTGAAGFAAVDFGSGNGGNGTSNSLAVAATGAVRNAGGLDEFAVFGRSGSESISNAGTITGSIDLGTGANSFDNLAGGRFEMGEMVKLGAGNTLTNRGTLSPGGSGTISTVAMTGNLAQEAGGTLAIDVSGSANTADRINLSGTAQLAGTVKVNLLNPVSTNQTFTVLSATDGVTDNGLTLTGGLPVSFRLLYPNPNDVVIGATVDLGIDDLNWNQTRLAENLNTIIEGGGGGVTPIINALIGIDDLHSYKDALNQLLPEPYLHAAMSGAVSVAAFGDTLFGCAQRSAAYVTNDSCIWAEAGASTLDREASYEYLDAHETSQWIAGGAETPLSNSFVIGAGLRYERVNQDVYDNAHTEGARAAAGASLKYVSGSLMLGAAAAVGHGWLDTERNFTFNGFSGTASGESSVGTLHGKLRAEYLVDLGMLQMTPRLDLDATRISSADVTESGGNGAALRIDGADKSLFSASPSLELGGSWEVSGEVRLRPYARAGATLYGDTRFSTSSRFRAAPDGTPDFETREELDSVVATLSAGLEVYAPGGASLRLSYDGVFGETTRSNTGGLTAELRF